MKDMSFIRKTLEDIIQIYIFSKFRDKLRMFKVLDFAAFDESGAGIPFPSPCHRLVSLGNKNFHIKLRLR